MLCSSSRRLELNKIAMPPRAKTISRKRNRGIDDVAQPHSVASTAATSRLQKSSTIPDSCGGTLCYDVVFNTYQTCVVTGSEDMDICHVIPPDRQDGPALLKALIPEMVAEQQQQHSLTLHDVLFNSLALCDEAKELFTAHLLSFKHVAPQGRKMQPVKTPHKYTVSIFDNTVAPAMNKFHGKVVYLACPPALLNWHFQIAEVTNAPKPASVRVFAVTTAQRKAVDKKVKGVTTQDILSLAAEAGHQPHDNKSKCHEWAIAD